MLTDAALTHHILFPILSLSCARASSSLSLSLSLSLTWRHHSYSSFFSLWLIEEFSDVSDMRKSKLSTHRCISRAALKPFPLSPRLAYDNAYSCSSAVHNHRRAVQGDEFLNHKVRLVKGRHVFICKVGQSVCCHFSQLRHYSTGPYIYMTPSSFIHDTGAHSWWPPYSPCSA